MSAVLLLLTVGNLVLATIHWRDENYDWALLGLLVASVCFYAADLRGF